MRRPANYQEKFLHPGEYCWGEQNTRIRTILGSCVTLTTWHPRLLVGGMTHIIMPERSDSQREDETLNARYAEDAIKLLVNDMQRHDADLKQFQLKLFGGGDMFGTQESMQRKNSKLQIGEKNIDVTRKILKNLKLNIHASHVGGVGHRSVIFDIWSGYVWVRHESLGKKGL